MFHNLTYNSTCIVPDVNMHKYIKYCQITNFQKWIGSFVSLDLIDHDLVSLDWINKNITIETLAHENEHSKKVVHESFHERVYHTFARQGFQ